MTGRPQEIDHAAGPGLPEILKEVGQLAQVMGIAQTVLAEEVTIRLPAIVNEGAQEAGQNSQGIERLLAAFRMAGDPGQQRGRQDVHPVQRAGDTQPGLIGVRDIGDLKGLADGAHRRRQPDPGLL